MNDPISNWGNLQTPYSQEAEEATIGAILVNPVMYFSIAAFLTAEDFFYSASPLYLGRTNPPPRTRRTD